MNVFKYSYLWYYWIEDTAIAQIDKQTDNENAVESQQADMSKDTIALVLVTASLPQAADQLSIRLLNNTPLCSVCTGGMTPHKFSFIHTHKRTCRHTVCNYVPVSRGHWWIGRCGTHHNLQQRLPVRWFVTRHLPVPEHNHRHTLNLYIIIR